MQTLAELCTVHIESRLSHDTLPPEQHLRRFLRVFGKIIALYDWPSDELRDSRPNNALVMFESPSIAEDVLASSGRHGPNSFWTTQSLAAHYLRPEFMERFEKGLKANKYMDQLKASPSAGPSKLQTIPEKLKSKRQSPPSGPRQTCSEASLDEPPTKKSRKSSPRYSMSSGYNQASSSKQPVPSSSTSAKSHAKSPIPPSPEWMQARIKQLEVELGAANAARDLALSEQSMVSQSFEVEKQGRRKALTQKSAAEAALSRAEAEQARLLEELQQRQKSGSSDELRSQLQAVQTMLLEVRNSTDEQGTLLKKREAELEEARDAAHKLQIKLTEVEQNEHLIAGQLQEARNEVKDFKSQLEDLQNELEGVRKASNKYELKYRNEKSKRTATKDKLAEYKSRLQLNNCLSEQLRDTAPAALEGLKAVMEAMGLPPLRDQEQLLTPKTESD